MFNSPQEAIEACNNECERAWQEFATANQLDPNLAPEAFGIAKMVFRSGYMAGAKFISGNIVKAIEQKKSEKAQQS